MQRLGLTRTGDWDVIQHIELPETPVHVTEHRLIVYQDADSRLYIPDCPEAKGPIFGPRLLATIGWLKSVGHCSDIRFLEKHPDKKTKAWAEQLLDRSRRLFSAWHRRGEMTAEGFHRSMLTHRDRFLELIRQPPSTKEAQKLLIILPSHNSAVLGAPTYLSRHVGPCSVLRLLASSSATSAISAFQESLARTTCNLR